MPLRPLQQNLGSGNDEETRPAGSARMSVGEVTRAVDSSRTSADDTYHYPKEINIDPVERTADDEITYRVQKFIPSGPAQ
ncbi:MAG TPA: DUF6174 domain-containing protein [Gemmatimonadaceae bacterium]